MILAGCVCDGGLRGQLVESKLLSVVDIAQPACRSSACVVSCICDFVKVQMVHLHCSAVTVL